MKRYVLKRTSLLNRTSYNDSASNKFRKKNRAEACSEPCKTSKMELLVRKRRRAPTTIIYIRATQRTFQPGLEKINKIHPENNSLYFRKWNFLTLRLTNFLYFLKKSFSYISGNETLHFPAPALKIFPKKTIPKKFLIFRKIELKKLLILQKMELSYIFPKESFSYTSGNGNPEKISYIF